MEAHDFDALLRSVAEEVREPIKKNLFDNEEPDLFGSHISAAGISRKPPTSWTRPSRKRKTPPRPASKSSWPPISASTRNTRASTTATSSSSTSRSPISPVACWPTGCRNTSSRPPAAHGDRPRREKREQMAALREAGTLRRIKRFANALIDGVPVRDKDRPGSDVDLLDWLRQCRRAGLYEQGRAIYEKGGLNLANLTDEQQIEAEDDYRICARRGSDQEAKPKNGSVK